MLVWLTLFFYDFFCGFRSVAVNSVYKLQFFLHLSLFINCSYILLCMHWTCSEVEFCAIRGVRTEKMLIPSIRRVVNTDTCCKQTESLRWRVWSALLTTSGPLSWFLLARRWLIVQRRRNIQWNCRVVCQLSLSLSLLAFSMAFCGHLDALEYALICTFWEMWVSLE